METGSGARHLDADSDLVSDLAWDRRVRATERSQSGTWMERDAFTTTFADRLEDFGGQIAITTADGETISYRALAESADAFAWSLGPGRHLLAIEAANEPAPLVAYLAALRARHPVILHGPGSAEKDARFIQTFRPDAVFRKAAGGWSLERPYGPGQGDLHGDLAVLLSTSGSTGSPKLVRLSRQNIASNAASIVTYLGLTADERPITTLPWHYSYGLSVIHSHLECGAEILLSERSVVEPEFWSFFEKHGGTSLAGVPHTFELLDRINFRSRQHDGLRYLTVAGGRLPAEKVVAFARWAKENRILFFVMYGQTEAAPRMAFLPPELAEDYPDCIGIPVPGGALRLLGSSGCEIAATGEAGQLAYRGPNVMMGYATTRDDLAKGPELEELLTGDIATRNERGLYKIVGRESRFSKIFGLRIDLDEVERYLAQVGFPSAVAGDDHHIAVCTQTPFGFETLPTLLANRFSLNATCISVLFSQEYPLLASGKVDYQEILRRAGQARVPETRPQDTARVSHNPAVPRGPALRETFCWALNRNAVSDLDSFVTLGGDSLSYVQVSMGIETYLGYLPENWEELTVAQIEGLAAPPGATAANVAPRAEPSLLDMEIFLRAFAILGVVFNHASTTVGVGGGSSLLFMLAGVGFARFQKSKLFAGNVLQALTPFSINVVTPYYLMVLAYSIALGKFDLPRLLLISNYFGRFSGFLQIFWFIEVLLQCLVVFSLPFLIPGFRRWVASEPWKAGFALLVLALVVHFVSCAMWDRHALDDRVVETTLHILLFGWCMHFATTVRRKLVMTGTALVVFPLTQLHGSESVWLIVGTMLLLWVPRLSMLPPAKAAVAMVGSVSFFIYLTHFGNVHLLRFVLHWHNEPAMIIAALVLSVISGALAGWGFKSAGLVVAGAIERGRRADVRQGAV